MDRIILSGLTFYAYHGVHPEERALGQRFVVDVTLARDLRPGGESDDVNQTTSYSAVYKTVKRVVEGPPLNLIEAVAERIAAAILAEHGGDLVTVRVAKPWAPVKGMTEGLAAVEITRRNAR